jgi:hypothetical protein
VSTDRSTTLASELDRLFEAVRSPQGRHYSYREVAEDITSRGGARVSATYIWQLRTGPRANPNRKHIKALAVNYFFDDERHQMSRPSSSK